MLTLRGDGKSQSLASQIKTNFTAGIPPYIKRRYLTMSKKNSVQKYFNEMLVEYGKVLNMDSRTWHF